MLPLKNFEIQAVGQAFSSILEGNFGAICDFSFDKNNLKCVHHLMQLKYITGFILFYIHEEMRLTNEPSTKKED